MSTIKVYRERDPRFIEKIKNDLIVWEESFRPTLIAEIVRRMIELPDSIYLVVSTVDDEITGFLIGVDGGLGYPAITLIQAWSKGNTSKTGDEMFSHLLLWAISLGKVSIKAESKRDEKALFRRAGFKPIAQVYSMDITTEMSKALLIGGMEIMKCQQPQQ